jgi:hypothetical protein
MTDDWVASMELARDHHLEMLQMEYPLFVAQLAPPLPWKLVPFTVENAADINQQLTGVRLDSYSVMHGHVQGSQLGTIGSAQTLKSNGNFGVFQTDSVQQTLAVNKGAGDQITAAFKKLTSIGAGQPPEVQTVINQNKQAIGDSLGNSVQQFGQGIDNILKGIEQVIAAARDIIQFVTALLKGAFDALNSLLGMVSLAYTV